MTTYTEDEQQLTFAEPQAAEKPTLICAGHVTKVGEAKISGSGKNITIPIDLEPVDAGRKQRVYFNFRPEWLTVGFKPYELEKQDSKAHFTYKKNIADQDNYSVLRGLSGSKLAFARLANTLLHLPTTEQEFNDEQLIGPVMEDVADALREFFEGNVDDAGQPVIVGYVLAQETTKTDETTVDEHGKIRNVYVRENRYGLDRNNPFWDVTSGGIKKMIAKAEASNGKIRMTYAGLPF
jgi:hypothetical protein